jgi:hypothetical protein
MNLTPPPVTPRRSWPRGTRLVATGLAAMLSVGLGQVPASAATPAGVHPTQTAAGADRAGHPRSAAKLAVAPKPPAAEDKPAPVWPTPGAATVDVPPPRRSAPAQPGSLPVRVSATGRTGADTPGRVRVEILDQTTTAKAGVRGVLLRPGRDDGATTAGEVNLTVDYSRFATGCQRRRLSRA